MDIEINDLASIGAIRDVEGYMLPPEAFTTAENMRVTGEGIQRVDGQTQIFGTPGVAPHFAMPISSTSQTFWLYTSLTKAYVYDGSTHTNITRQTAGNDVNYTPTNTREWNGTLLGGVPILNNGVDLPQYWSALNTATKLVALTNWDANERAKVFRAFGPFLIALHVTKNGGVVYPHMVKWSHPADPGSIPVSWDETDATRDAGEKDLPDVLAGTIQDGLPLRGHFYIYKEGSVWRMSNIGGNFIFDFDTFLETAGILAPRCVTVTGDGTRHVFASQDDLLVHNGNSVESILDERYKRYLVNNIDTDNYVNSFIYTDPFRNEVVFCYPESGSTQPNKAIIWNYKLGRKGAITERAINIRNATIGIIESASDATWDSIVGTWDDQSGPWSQNSRRRVVGCGTDATKFFDMDLGSQFNGSNFTGTLQRTGLGLVGRKRNGEWIVDFTKQKTVHRVWIKAAGAPFSVRIGSSETPEGPITWSAAKTFTPGTDNYVDITTSGKALAIEFTGTGFFRVMGYKLELNIVGRF